MPSHESISRRLKNGFAWALPLALAFGLSACGVGVRQSPAADADTGTVHAAAEQPATYTTQPGDTLLKVSARPDVYGDPELWPLLLDANAQTLAGASARGPLAVDTVLVIPRDASQSEIEDARARARRAAIERKARERSETGTLSAPGAFRSPRSGASVASAPAGNSASASAPAALSVTAPATAVPPTVAPTPAAAAPAPAKSGRTLPLLLLLVLVLAALAAVFFVFFRRDKKDFD